jgi:aminodeoxyfutalosine synthase
MMHSTDVISNTSVSNDLSDSLFSTEVHTESLDFDSISKKALSGKRISEAEALWLYKSAPLRKLGYLAHQLNVSKNGLAVFYNINRHINPTNICALSCKFCAYSKKIGDVGSYAYEIDEMIQKAQEAVDQGATELHMVGGLHPRWGFSRYTDMIQAMRKAFPNIHLKAFTAVELDWMARKSRKTISEVILELKNAGLDSFPGGGAEIFHPEVRDKICDTKVSGEQWIDTHRTAHGLGMRSNCTMLYGHIETLEHRIDHMRRLRDLQDETRGFNVFIPLSFQPFQNEMGIDRYTVGVDDLRTIAVARIFLDNFKHIKAYWVMLGQDIAQLALQFGANDLDGTVIEEKISKAAGGRSGMVMTRSNLENFIRRSDRIPVERTTLYQPIKPEEEKHCQPLVLFSHPIIRTVQESLNDGVGLSSEHLWSLMEHARFEDLLGLLNEFGTKKTKFSDPLRKFSVQNFEEIFEVGSLEALLRLDDLDSSLSSELVSFCQTTSSAENQPLLRINLEAITRDLFLTKQDNSPVAVCSSLLEIKNRHQNLRFILTGLDESKNLLKHLFQTDSASQLSLHRIEFSSKDDLVGRFEETLEAISWFHERDIHVQSSVTLIAKDLRADWFHFATQLQGLTLLLAKNPSVQQIKVNVQDLENSILAIEYARALALTKIVCGQNTQLSICTMSIPTSAPERGIGAHEDQHPLIKLISVLQAFGVSQLENLKGSPTHRYHGKSLSNLLLNSRLVELDFASSENSF